MGIGRPATKLPKILTAMYSSPGMFGGARRPARTRRSGTWSASPSRSAPRGRGLRDPVARYMLDGIGLKQDEDFKSIYLDRAGDGPAMMQFGRAAALWGAGISLARLRDHGRRPRRRPLHRPRYERDRAHPRQALRSSSR